MMYIKIRAADVRRLRDAKGIHITEAKKILIKEEAQRLLHNGMISAETVLEEFLIYGII